MITRNLTSSIESALKDSPVVFLAGARQTGKSTLVQSIAATLPGYEYLTLDDSSQLASARNNPQGFIEGLPTRVIIDEVQRVPDLFTSIKMSVDRNRQPGRFILTGSANVLVLPKLSESLAGRMEVLTLWPLSQGELLNKKETFIDHAFAGDLRRNTAEHAHDENLWDRIIVGGYPEVRTRTTATRREAWFRSYIDTITQRDIRDLADIESLTQIPALLKLLAGRIGSLVNFADLSRSLQIPQTTLKRYMALLEATFLISRLPPWHVNINNRIVKAPKLFFPDSGLASYLLGAEQSSLSGDRSMAGRLFENFVVGEIVRQIGWAGKRYTPFFFRTQTGREVDLVLESPAGKCIAVEIKVSSSVKPDDSNGLRFLKETIGNRFAGGIILYTGNQMVPIEKDICALPVGTVWNT